MSALTLPQPSKVARFMAAANWPDVQRQTMIAKGIYWFSCAGHGGCLAVHGVADIPESAWEVARAMGHTAYVACNPGRMYDSCRYRFDTNDERVVELWVGEEDCEWSTIFVAHADTAALVKRADSKGFSFGDVEYCERSCKDYFPDTYTALTGEPVAVEESGVLKRRKFEADHATTLVAISAWGDWHEKVPEGMVGVFATYAGKRDSETWALGEWFLVPQDDYRADREHGYVITGTEVEWTDHP